jgi:molybdopterin-containing oxidoreductase family membrane subunit
MEAQNTSYTTKIEEFRHQIEKPTTTTWVWIAFLIVLILMAIYALIAQITDGHIITGMRDNVVWGIYIVNFIFFMGISYAGALISGGLHLFRTDWRHPVIRMAEAITIISLLIGPLYILLCIGRLDRIPYLVLFGRIQSPITWDVIAISTDIIGCLIYLYLSTLRDIARVRDFKNLKMAKWRKKLYKVLALGYTGLPEQQKRLNRAADIMAAMVMAIAIIVYSVLAWIFSVTLQPGWHSTIFGPYFVIAAVYSGTGVLILVMWIYRKIFHLEEYITKKHFINVGIIMMVLAAFFGYFTFSEYLTKWYGSQKDDEQLISILFDRYYMMFVFSNYIGVILPLLVIGIPALRKINIITFTAVVVILALWINRYLIVVPTLEAPYMPIQESRLDWIHYSGTWIEWTLTLGGIATFCLLFTLFSKFIPIVELSSPKIKKSDV